MRVGERRLILETPDMHTSTKMQAFIQKEVERPCKQWIHEVLCNKRETERVKLRTNDFVLLPDVECAQKRVCRRLVERDTAWKVVEDSRYSIIPFISSLRSKKKTDGVFHWLAVVTDTSLRTIRDLRGSHVPMLKELQRLCLEKIREETGVDENQIMAYVHYPPSVYQLHIHFKHPVWPYSASDALRVHSMSSIINNLCIDSDYYVKSPLQLPVYLNTDLFSALEM